MDAGVVRKTVISNKRLVILAIIPILGCRSQSATETIEARLRTALPQHASRVQVEQFLQREHAEIFQKDRGIVNARFRGVRKDFPCVIDVSVDLVFDESQALIDRKSQEMRICL